MVAAALLKPEMYFIHTERTAKSDGTPTTALRCSFVTQQRRQREGEKPVNLATKSYGNTGQQNCSKGIYNLIGWAEIVIHWIQLTAEALHVHSFYSNQDQLAQQDQRFRGRTSLFKDQISRGNASLQLTGVELQDQGKFRCYTSTITGTKESFINLKVEAPVRKVDIQQVENRITCSSEGIYPEPQLTWSTNPPSNMTLQNKTTVHQTEQQLYNINSYLTVSDSAPDLVYSCTVSTHRNRRRATLFKPTSINSSDTETTIPCTSSNTPLTGLIWRFNHSQIILKQTRPNVPYTVSEEWRQQVKSVSESGNLTLQDVSSDQDGIYTCELSDDEETYVTNTFLRIEKGQGQGKVA
ncbi:hypothetical protein ABVT39_011149 [Epinephelus coioides]